MWNEENNAISKEFKFEDFKTALAFVNEVGRLAEEVNHHPDIELSWGRAKVTLTTHSEGKVTDKDRELAQKIDEIQN
jgi:4a-hydroxytetrahydrobiopterin dehydratase